MMFDYKDMVSVNKFVCLVSAEYNLSFSTVKEITMHEIYAAKKAAQFRPNPEEYIRSRVGREVLGWARVLESEVA